VEHAECDRYGLALIPIHQFAKCLPIPLFASPDQFPVT